MISIPQIFLPFAVALFGLAAPVDDASEGGAHPMAGEWQLNEKLSESPRDAMRSRRGGRGGRGGGGGFGRGGGGAGVQAGGGGQRQGAGARREGGQRGGRGPAQELTVAVSADSFVLTAGERPAQSFALGDDIGDGVAVADGEGFVVQSETPRGDLITRKFSLAKKGQRLQVTTTLPAQGGGEDIQFTTVYDRVEGE